MSEPNSFDSYRPSVDDVYSMLEDEISHLVMPQHQSLADTSFADLILHHAKFFVFFDDIATQENKLGYIESGSINIADNRRFFVVQLSCVIWLAHLCDSNFDFYNHLFDRFKSSNPSYLQSDKADYVTARLPMVNWNDNNDLLEDLYDLVAGYSGLCKNLVQIYYRDWVNDVASKYIVNKFFDKKSLATDLDRLFPRTQDLVDFDSLSDNDIMSILMRDIYNGRV